MLLVTPSLPTTMACSPAVKVDPLALSLGAVMRPPLAVLRRSDGLR
jgi:hypothetical protein